MFGFFSKIFAFFKKGGEILAKCWDFFQKLLGFLKKVGKFLQNVGIFGRKLWWGQVGIFGKFGGDFLPEPSGNTDIYDIIFLKKKLVIIVIESSQNLL